MKVFEIDEHMLKIFGERYVSVKLPGRVLINEHCYCDSILVKESFMLENPNYIPRLK